MKIDAKKIRYTDFIEWADDTTIEEVKKAIQPKSDFDFWSLTIADFGMITNGKIPQKLLSLFEVERKNVLFWHKDVQISVATFFQLQKAVENFMQNYIKMLQEYSIKETSEERQASANLPHFNENEGLLVFARRYFGLSSFEEAEKVSLGDLFLAKKDTYISTMYERNLNNIISNKYKMRK